MFECRAAAHQDHSATELSVAFIAIAHGLMRLRGQPLMCGLVYHALGKGIMYRPL